MNFTHRNDRQVGDTVHLVKGNNVGCGLINGDTVEIPEGIGTLGNIYYVGGATVTIDKERYWVEEVKLITKK